MIAPLLLGLLSSLHCVGMCGPLVMALPVYNLPQYQRILMIIVYHFGRILTYALLGLLFGSLGKGLFIAGFQQNLSIFLGIILIVIAFLSFKNIERINIFQKSKIFQKIKNYFSQFIKQRTPISFFSMGVLNGLLPCAMVYFALFGALSTQGIWHGAWFMLIYGLGTLPLLFFISEIGKFLNIKWRNYLLRLVPVILILMGSLLIIRGLGLNITYLSPTQLQLFIGANPDCF